MQSIQLISRIDNNKWWKDLFIHYASKGEMFEIRCWDEETESIDLIRKFGNVQKSQTTKEVIISGYITNEFIDFIVKEEMPKDQNIYNKMTQFFTINIDKSYTSAHYGTEIYIDEDFDVFYKKYGCIFECAIFPNGEKGFFYCVINYYDINTTKEIIKKLEKNIEKEYETLIEWLRIAVEKYNGFYILGL